MQNKVLTLDSLIMSNFKKIREKESVFNPIESTIIGPNGSGKSTHWDAWYWLWTSYDLERRFNDEVKPWINQDRKTEDRVVVSVTGNITSDGDKYSLRKELHEVWEPLSDEDPRDVYKSDTTKFWINGSPIPTKKEWEERLNAIYPIAAFAAVTNPDYFLRMKTEDMRKVIINMVGGDVTNEEIVAANPSFTKLVETILKTRTIDQYKKEITDNTKANQDKQKSLPKSIKDKENEVAKIIAEHDFDATQVSIDVKKEALQIVENELETANNSEEGKGKLKIQQEVTELEADIKRYIQTFKNNRDFANSTKLSQKQTIGNEIKNKNSLIMRNQSELEFAKNTIVNLENQRLEKIEKWTAINQLQFLPVEAFVDPSHEPECDHCKRAFSLDEYSSFESVLREAFNKKKKEDKDKINSEGKEIVAKMDTFKDGIPVFEKTITDSRVEVEDLQRQFDEIKIDDSTPEEQEEYGTKKNDLLSKRQSLEEYDSSAFDITIRELENKKVLLNNELAELNRLLGKKDSIDIIRASISTLEAEKIVINKAVLDWKKADKVLTSYLKERASILEGRVNVLFEHMKFSMFTFNNDGTSKIDCTPIFDKSSYKATNTGFKPMLYVDIANAFTKTYKTALPIFLDNMESVGKRPDTISQVINIEFLKYDGDVKSLEVIEGKYQPKKSK